MVLVSIIYGRSSNYEKEVIEGQYLEIVFFFRIRYGLKGAQGGWIWWDYLRPSGRVAVMVVEAHTPFPHKPIDSNLLPHRLIRRGETNRPPRVILSEAKDLA